MNQKNLRNDSATPVSVIPAKRRRGRPRKDENPSYMEKASGTPGLDVMKRNRHQSSDSTAHSDNALVGQIVSGVLDGSFDAGYLLTVKVGNTNTLLRGVVFDPGLSVPISATNDVAPHIKMFKRSEIPLPVINPLNQVPVCTPPYYEVKNEQPAKPVPKSVTVIPFEGSPSDNTHRPKGPSNDANHGSQVAHNQSSIKTESLATLHAKGWPDGVHQTLPIASQASQSNIEKGKSINISSNETTLVPKGAVVNCNQSPSIPAQTAEKSDITVFTEKSSDDFNKALPVVAQALPSEPKTENLVLVLQESETSLQRTKLLNGSSATKDLKLKPKTDQSVEMSSGDESGKEVQLAINQVPQVQTQVLGSALNLDLTFDALKGLQEEVNHSPLEAAIGMSQENETSPFNGPALADIQAHLVAPRETMSDLSNEILERDETTHLIEGSLTDAIDTTIDDLCTQPTTDAHYDIQSGFAAYHLTLTQHALGPQISNLTSPIQEESLIARDAVSVQAPSNPVESVTSTGFMEPEAAYHTQVKQVGIEATPEGSSGI